MSLNITKASSIVQINLEYHCVECEVTYAIKSISKCAILKHCVDHCMLLNTHMNFWHLKTFLYEKILLRFLKWSLRDVNDNKKIVALK